MITVDKTQVQIALGFLDTCTDPRTGFLPTKAPLYFLAEPFADLSKACDELENHYAGQRANCRTWLENQFSQPKQEWLEALDKADESTLDAVMTQVSLLCHAYYCANSNGIGLADRTPPPPGLDTLWAKVATLLKVPKVGNFFALVSSNWRMDGVRPGSEYDSDSVVKGATTVLFQWLEGPLVAELDEFLGFFLDMEAKGARLAETISDILKCILNENTQEATYHVMMLSAQIASLSSTYSRAFKKVKSAPPEFDLVFKPTLVLDEEDGASGLQSCTFQLLGSFLGLNPETEFGQAMLAARKFMNPELRKLLKVLDQTHSVVRDFVESARSPRLLEAFNRCLSHMTTWRLLYVKRGCLLSSSERKTPIVSQASILESDWRGLEWSLDSLFRFLTDEQRASLAQSTQLLDIKAGERIIQEGDLFPGLYELESGSASVRMEDGGEEPLNRIGTKEVFGEMSLIENLPASASIIADSDLQARHISLETVYQLLNKHRDAEGGFYLALGQLISHRLRRSV